MKKQILFLFLCVLLALPYAAKSEDKPGRGLLVSTIQAVPVFSSREEITKLVDFAGKHGIKTLFVQIYRANEAWFPSKAAGTEHYKTCFKNISEDPFSLLIEQAHSRGIEVYAWLNLLSLSTNKNALLLKKYGTGILTRNIKKKRKLEDYKIDNQYFMEPGDLRVRKELSSLTEEILRTYPKLDGILFDYIRYPDEKPAYGFTRINIKRFKEATGSKTIEEDSLSWKDWKRKQVTELLEELVKKTRAIRPDIQISATGCAPYSRAYYEAFQDWPSWLKHGLVDSVTVMAYSTDVAEFEKDIKEAKTKTEYFKKINLTVGAYKAEDSYEAFAQRFKQCNASGCNSCVLFHYGSLLQNLAIADFLHQEKKSR